MDWVSTDECLKLAESCKAQPAVWDGSTVGMLKLWDTATHRELVNIETYGVFSLAFSPDSKTLASAAKDGTILLWDLTATPAKTVATLKEHTGPVLGVAFAPDGKLLASAGEDKKVVIWDAKKGGKKQTLEGHPQPVHHLDRIAHDAVTTSCRGGRRSYPP